MMRTMARRMKATTERMCRSKSLSRTVPGSAWSTMRAAMFTVLPQKVEHVLRMAKDSGHDWAYMNAHSDVPTGFQPYWHAIRMKCA